jgi:hypothetical protein
MGCLSHVAGGGGSGNKHEESMTTLVAESDNITQSCANKSALYLLELLHACC